MSNNMIKPSEEAMIYEDEVLYACLATYPIAKGHVVVILKKDVSDLGRLDMRDYDYLMNTVTTVRDAMIKALDIKKVYLVYMDEIQHVHWHLIPRYNEKGYDVFLHEPTETKDFSLASKIKKELEFK